MNAINITAAAVSLFVTASNLLAQSPGFLTNGLVACYQFNGNADDSSGNSNNGTPNSITFVADRFGFGNNAASFAGNSTSYIDVTTTNLNLNPPFTVSVWISYNNLGQGGPRIFSTSGYEMTLGDSGHGPTTAIIVNGMDPGLTSTATVRAGVWSHVVGIWTTNSLSIYINGVACGSIPPNPSIDFSRWPYARIGGNSGKTSDDNYGGLIDNLRIYNRAFSVQEVAALYDTEAPIVGIMLLPTVTVRGVPGKTYDIQYVEEASARNWATWLSNIAFPTNGLYIFPDTNALNQPKRFYRAFVQ